jgi:uncharacterized protein (TIGR01244 family)
MEPRKINDAYSVSGQILADEVAGIAAAGFKSIICNRPDNEQPGQPSHAEIEAAAKKAGLQFRHIPAISGALTPENVDDTAEALAELPGPVFAYCRSGARSSNLYMLATQAKK